MRRSHLALLLAPSLLLIVVFFAALSSVLVMSAAGPDGSLSLSAYARMLGDAFYRDALLRSIWIAAYCTAICLLLGYPIAYVMSRGARRFATIATLVLSIQFFSIYVVKMYGWMLVLGNNGVINRSLMATGITSSPVKLMYNELGVAIGLVASALPLMVFPVHAVLQNVSPRFEEAALGLGAGRWRALYCVTLPLSAPGVIGGSVLTFVFCFTAYLTPALLGGGFYKMIGNLIYEQAVGRFNYTMAGAAAVLTLVVSLFIIVSIGVLGPKALRTRTS
ncbi:MAG: ABC transporter permease [Variibacter sp.]|nr:ABC transporter permease [Variibacter sp.]